MMDHSDMFIQCMTMCMAVAAEEGFKPMEDVATGLDHYES